MMSATTNSERNATIPVVDRIHGEEAGTARPLGFIGLGAMGLPMAASAARHHALLACDTDPVRIALLIEEVGQLSTVHTTPVPAEVGARCDVVVLMLPTSAQVGPVVRELAETLRPGGLVIDMGSSNPAETRRLAAELADRGIRLMDAPVSGSVVKALDGTLSILAGGAEADIERAMPYLRAMGERIIRTGPVGSAHAMKTLNNFVYAAGLLAASEALRMAEAAGLDLSILTDVLNASSGRNVATETKVRQFILPGSYEGGFRLGLMAKDLETAATFAEETGIEAASLRTCLAVWRRALDTLGPEADNTEIHRFLGPTPEPPSLP
ncbi:MAG: NAD(P)-dependent oxidoreductase [Acetobacteraceae bacterium]|nr:NAD(P)-dependent oxidoreductase [Acetobacteraceae bacterium]